MAIQAKQLKDLPEPTRKLYGRAKAAFDIKNYDYAFEMLEKVLQDEPGFIEGHQILRDSLLERAGGHSSVMRKMTSMFKTGPLLVQGPMLLKKGEFAKALQVGEKALVADPTNIGTLQFLAKAARAAGLAELAIQTLETASNLDGKNKDVLRELAEIHKEQQNFNKSIEAIQRLMKLTPGSIELGTELKQLTAQSTMKKDKWDEASSYRDVIRDKKQAELLEQETRSGTRDEAALKNLVAAAEKTASKQATTANIKALAELYVKDRQWDNAIVQYNHILEASGSMDPAIDEAITEIMVAKFDGQIDQWRDYVKLNPDQQAEADKNMALYEQQKQDMLFQRMLDRVQRYPNDASYRFSLGEMYFRRSQLDQAMAEFQLAQKSPQFRCKALAYMGKCTLQKGVMVELALEQFKAAIDGFESTDPMRKECLYDLGTAYEKLGQAEQALASFRDLYSLDVGYRDVSAKLEKYYKK